MRDWPSFHQPRTQRARPGAEANRLAVVLHGKISNEVHRAFQSSSQPSPGMVGLSYCMLRDMVLEPVARYFEGVDIFGHAWNPEAQTLVEALYKPTAARFEEDMMMAFDLMCRQRARTPALGGPGGFFPMSCGRTMSHLLGMHRAIQLKSRHEHKRGFQYRAVLVARWDVLFQHTAVAPWLGAVAKSVRCRRPPPPPPVAHHVCARLRPPPEG